MVLRPGICSARGSPDVIISDWLMPGMEGPELCKLVRAYPGPYTYFVLLTAFGDRAHALEGMQAGADDYLAKTLDVDDLHLRLIAAERISELHKRLAEQDARLRALAESISSPNWPTAQIDRTAHPFPGTGASRAHAVVAGRRRHRPLQAGQRPLRTRHRRRSPAAPRRDAAALVPRRGRRRALGWRGVRYRDVRRGHRR